MVALRQGEERASGNVWGGGGGWVYTGIWQDALPGARVPNDASPAPGYILGAMGSYLLDECHGDHLWRGGGVCVECGARLHCLCGRFVREDGIERHLGEGCPWLVAHLEEGHDMRVAVAREGPTHPL